MIIFSGVVSDEIQAKTMERKTQYVFRVAAIGSAALIIVSGIFWFIFWTESIKEWIMLSILLIGTTLLLLWNPRKKLPFRWEFHITIDEEKIVEECPLWPKPVEKPIKKIKRVLDYEDCYYVIYGDMNNSIVCQKDLLTEGSIEEFEALFQGKIIRKKK